MLRNQIEFFEAYWGAQRSGLYLVALPTRLTATEAGYILRDCSARLLIAALDLATADELVARREELAPALVRILRTGEEPDGWSPIRDAHPNGPIADESPGTHMPYSSGTTGRPKGVRLPLPSGGATDTDPLFSRLIARYCLDATTVYLSPAPLYHTAPLVYTSGVLRQGGHVVVMRAFDAERFLQAIELYRATVTQVVPTMLVRLLALPDAVRVRRDLSSLAFLIHAAAPCPVSVKRRVIEWLGPIVHEYYGGSEGVGGTAITADEWLRKPGSVGRANWGTIHVADERGEEVSAGETGTIYFDGGLVIWN